MYRYELQLEITHKREVGKYRRSMDLQSRITVNTLVKLWDGCNMKPTFVVFDLENNTWIVKFAFTSSIDLHYGFGRDNDYKSLREAFRLSESWRDVD